MSETDSPTDSSTGREPALDELLAVQSARLLRDPFVGAGRDYGPLGIYGGHLLGQALAAVFATVAEDKPAHSLHACFLKTGHPAAPIGYQVERVRDGRYYATRTVRAVQNDRTLMVMTASCKSAESGDEHQPAMPEVASPAPLARRRRQRGRQGLNLPFAGIGGVAIEPCEDWHPQAGPGGDPAIAVWTRAVLSAAADGRGMNFGRIFDGQGRLLASVAQEAMQRRN